MANDAAAMTAANFPYDFSKLEEHPSDEACRDVQRFLYREARLLDREQLGEWLELLVDPAIRYVVTSRELRYRNERRYTQPAEVFIYDDDYGFLKIRVDQSRSGMMWRADPAERYRRLVTNIEVFETGEDGEYAVRSNCLAQRSRRAYEVDQFIYCREDVLRRGSDGALRLAQRWIDFDERSVAGRNLALFL